MRDFICVNERYLAVVEKYQVIQTIERDRIVYLENSLVISESADSFINFDKL
jgi:alpha-N-acetylglucosamine transferase